MCKEKYVDVEMALCVICEHLTDTDQLEYTELGRICPECRLEAEK